MSTNSSIPPRRSRAQKKKTRIWPWVLVVLCFVGAAVAGALFASSSLIDKNPADKVEEGLLTAKDKSTIMIMGVDEREDDVGRSDTLMIATVDPKKNRAALLSIPRDTRVKIAGHGWDKINAAYAYGGERLTQRTVEDFLGVNMDHYVIINTHAFQKIIDAIGEELNLTGTGKRLYVTLGQFSMIRLERSVPLTLNAENYFPESECAGSSGDDPCTMFSRVRFPVEEFFPPESLPSEEQYRDLI